jgi:hypothetical protein
LRPAPAQRHVPWRGVPHLAADALEWCGASRAEPLHLEGLRERFLPEATFRGRRNAKFQYAVLAAAGVHGGTEPDLLDEVASWQADDFWQYAMYAAVAYIRAAAIRAGVLVRQACQDLDERPGHPAPCRVCAGVYTASSPCTCDTEPPVLLGRAPGGFTGREGEEHRSTGAGTWCCQAQPQALPSPRQRRAYRRRVPQVSAPR